MVKKSLTLSIFLIFLLSGCIAPNNPTQAEESRSDAILNEMEQSVEATVAAAPGGQEPEEATLPEADEVDTRDDSYAPAASSAIGEEAFEEEVVGRAILDSNDVDVEALDAKVLSFDFNDGCDTIYTEGDLTLSVLRHPQLEDSPAVGNLLLGLADGAELVNQYGGVCGVGLNVQIVDAEYDPATVSAPADLALEQPLPTFLLSYAGDGAAVTGEGAQAVLALEPGVFYFPAGDESEAVAVSEVTTARAVVAQESAEAIDVEDPYNLGYLLGYSAILSVVDLLQETSATVPLDTLTDGVILAVQQRS